MAGRKAAGQVPTDRVPEYTPVSYSKEQILSSVRYQDKKDLVSALLSEDGAYTKEMADKKINEFMKGKVN